jgi:hypothetical protein
MPFSFVWRHDKLVSKGSKNPTLAGTVSQTAKGKEIVKVGGRR